jgi:crotonobetainyl-CoA:carnitine CoA-transferase CaiB-like acyl-CoA transferase
MLDSMVNFLGGLVAETTVAGYRHTQFGNRSVSRKPTADRFRCGQGFIVLAVLTEKQFTALMTVLGRSDVLRDPRFGDWYTRTEHAAGLRAIIETAFGDGDPKEWEARLTAASVPCATVYRLEEVIEHPQVAHRGLMQSVETPYGPVNLVSTAIHLAHGQGGINRPVARAGEHNDEVLAIIGYDASSVADLRERHII